MFIIDDSADRALDSVTIYLTPDEARNLAAHCEHLTAAPVKSDHEHFFEFDESGQVILRHIRVIQYVDGDMDHFSARAQHLIKTGKWRRDWRGRSDRAY